MHFPAHVEIVEVGLRDGLQNEPRLVATDLKLQIIAALIDAGVHRLQVTSFVHPRLVPQMADAEDLCARLPAHPGVVYSGLVLNHKGLERAQAAGLRHVDVSLSASETHSQKNAGMSLSDARAQFRAMVAQAQQWDMHVRGGIQCAFGCAYEGAVPTERVLALAAEQIELGVRELALADSTGMANPRQVAELVQQVRPLAGNALVVLHLHDTRGMGLANLLAALDAGVTRFDTAFGGLGGCPFIPGAMGNIATEDSVHMLAALGITTGIDHGKVAACSRTIAEHVGRDLPAKMYRIEETRSS